MTLRDYAEQELFRPLGITDFTWDSDPSGITNGTTNLALRPRDMAKFGYLYLQHGRWNGTQLLPVDWVQASTSKHIETKGLMNAAEDDGYGYLWWIDSFGGYSAHGFGGQYIFVLPALDMVIVFMSGLPVSLFPTPNQLVRNFLIPAVEVTGPLPSNPQAAQALADRIRVIEQGEPSEAVLPEIAHQISGKTFRIVQKPYAGMYDAFTLTFSEGDTYQNEIEWPSDIRISFTGSLKHDFHLNQVMYPASPPVDLLLPLRGHWQDETTFVEEYIQNLNTDIELVTEKFTFRGDTVTIEATLGVSLETVRVSGEMVK
jgi:hypothetical protein